MIGNSLAKKIKFKVECKWGRFCIRFTDVFYAYDFYCISLINYSWMVVWDLGTYVDATRGSTRFHGVCVWMDGDDFCEPTVLLISTLTTRSIDLYVSFIFRWFKPGKCSFSTNLLCQMQLYSLLEAFIRVMNNLVTFQGEDNVLLWVFQHCCVLILVQFHNGILLQSIRYWPKETACMDL